MKTKIFCIFALAILGLSSVACEDYLSELPKGKKMPITFADYEALIRDEYGNHRTDITQTLLLLNDCFETQANLNYYPLRMANYMWDESANRIELNNSDETAFYNGYNAVSTCNLIMQYLPDATEATETQKNELIAQVRVIRALVYFYMVNFYSDTYDEATAATTPGIPWITSAAVGAAHQQLSVKEIYDNILNDIQEALPHLSASSATPLHPNLGAAHALRARIYLQMGKYTQALAEAESALGQNKQLYDWTEYYTNYQTQIEDPAYYTRIPSPTNYYYVENYCFRHGAIYYSSGENSLRIDRATRFEPGDARFAARWKLRTVGSDTYYYGMQSGFFNYGGLTTVEVHLIKAECLARAGQYQAAMDVLNTVRKTRILASHYNDVSAATEEQAIAHIRTTKDNELILSIVPFADARRFNKEAKYARSLQKTENGQNYSLLPSSHMWTMPFPMGATKNPGNGTITQNVSK